MGDGGVGGFGLVMIEFLFVFGFVLGVELGKGGFLVGGLLFRNRLDFVFCKG